MSAFTISNQENSGITTISFTGYFSPEDEESLREQMQKALRTKGKKCILNFTDCKVFCSPGVALVLDLVAHVRENLGGKTILVGLDSIKRKIFDMAGILQIATDVETIGQAKMLLGDDAP